ncbi:MAG: hypothetical protein N3A38_16760, partial [Planctomycetota bacterium]|nr:hypothetical protein [Planctomycetota bacterium]
MKNKRITKKVTKAKLLRIIKRRDTQSLLAIQEDQFDWEVLKQFGYEYKTLLEWIVSMGYVFKQEENLKRVVNDRGQTVAHVMAKNGYKFDPDKDADIIRLADNERWTVAHEMANKGYKFDPDRHREILLLANSRGNTVAHVMAKEGYLFDPDRHGEICELKDKKGYSVLERFIWGNDYAILSGHKDQDFMRLSIKGIEKYMQTAKKINIGRGKYTGMDVYKHLKKILNIKKKVDKLPGELEKELGSLGLK